VIATAIAGVAVAAVRLAVDDNDVSPGVVGFLVVALLGGATYLLIRSMNRQIRRIDLPDDAADNAPDDDHSDGADDDDADDPGGVSPR
jgi:hypothetical protein